VNALADPEVGKFLNKHFVSSFQKVATFQIVNGAKQGGNVASYFCAPDGRVLHVVAGPVDAGTLLAEARWVVESVRKATAESGKTGVPFKALFRRWHSERLRNEHGIIVEPVTFDSPLSQDADDPVTYNDPSGRPIVPVLPPPPIDGPDVDFDFRKTAGECCEPSAPGLRDKCGRPVALGNQGRVHQLMSAYSLVKIDRVYGTVFENILGEKVSTKPVVTINSQVGRDTDLCLTCESLKEVEGR
jgi:hypothetical protein